jgi:hypothetical protein
MNELLKLIDCNLNSCFIRIELNIKIDYNFITPKLKTDKSIPR